MHSVAKPGIVVLSNCGAHSPCASQPCHLPRAEFREIRLTARRTENNTDANTRHTNPTKAIARLEARPCVPRVEFGAERAAAERAARRSIAVCATERRIGLSRRTCRQRQRQQQTHQQPTTHSCHFLVGPFERARDAFERRTPRVRECFVAFESASTSNFISNNTNNYNYIFLCQQQ